MSRFTADPFWIARKGRLLGNGRYHVVLDARGGGVSLWRELQLSAWHPDPVSGGGGWWIALGDDETGRFWLAAPGPFARAPRHCRVQALPGVHVYRVRHGWVQSVLEIWVDAERDCEFRRLTVINEGSAPVPLVVTSACDVVLHLAAAHRAHPAFSKLFVESRWDAEVQALCFRRRPRSNEERWPLLAYAICEQRPTEWESDRAKFLGRWRDATCAAALLSRAPLPGSHGPVLDPTAALRQRLILQAGASAQWTFVAAVGDSQEELSALFGQLREPGAAERSREQALHFAHEQLRRLELSFASALEAEEVGVAVQYGCGAQSLPTAGEAGARSKPAVESVHPLLLWKTSASERARERLQAVLSLWRERGFAAEVLALHPRSGRIWFCHGAKEESLLRARRRGLAEADLYRAASCTVEGARLALPRARVYASRRARYRPRLRSGCGSSAEPMLEQANGYGGFDPQNGDYVISLRNERIPPMPWVNVIANPRIGCLASERGAVHTWGENSREDRLTPWSNDPVSDPFYEALYLRDEDRRVFWSPLPGPAVSAEQHEVRHGLGFSRWRSEGNGLHCTVTLCVTADDPVRLLTVEVQNHETKARHLSAWWYAELVLGSLPEETRRWIDIEWLAGSRVLLARRYDRPRRFSRLVFASASGGRDLRAGNCRLHFVGSGRSLAAPRALQEDHHVTPCRTAHGHPAFVLQVPISVGPRGTARVLFLFGEARSVGEVQRLVERHRNNAGGEAVLELVRAGWRTRLSSLSVRTPIPALDRLVNQWAVYQTLSCRLWGRSAFYQSGGAFGFRDQLQDACALLWLDPAATRRQILLHAAHQFPEGDVLHWWHPPWERGTRTRFSDDLLWLPWAVVWYSTFTGDFAILDEPCPFVEARPLAPGEDEAYLQVRRSHKRADLYTHCCLAIDRSLTRGPHGLPLMGTGDWNDGMNRVGRGGKGESVWLGFFLGGLLHRFVPICEARGDGERARHYRRHAARLQEALETAGWDGRWYRRAYYDDGSPLGSAQNRECRIDALVQAWAVISGLAPRERAHAALDAVLDLLVDREAGIVRLLYPPFDRDPHDPGYIKGYVPGIRENGGQYTHAALWVVEALARLGRRDQAWELLGRMLPQWHARDPDAVRRYQVEPYVIAADIYGEEPHRGRGGWTWYTGSAGWLYRVAVETLLGLRLERGDTLIIAPRIPDRWPGYELTYRPPGGESEYRIVADNPAHAAEQVVHAWLDGQPLPVRGQELRVPLTPGRHEVAIRLGRVTG